MKYFFISTLKIAVAASACLAFNSCTKCSSSSEIPPATTTDATPAPTTPPEAPKFEIVDITVGSGAEAVDGKKVTVHYTGTLQSGVKFDSSVDRGDPFSFLLGAGQVIQGWDQGVKGMKVGGKRKLTIPPELGYGSKGVGGVIPENAVLLFDVELLNVE
jgi:FKBP-type peptidyl-prolyl cis-trans isomerase